MRRMILILIALAMMPCIRGYAADEDAEVSVMEIYRPSAADRDSMLVAMAAVTAEPADMPVELSLDLEGQDSLAPVKGREPVSIYALPYSLTQSVPCWRRLWINTGVLTTAFVGTLVVLECLPEDATNWNRAEIQSVPLFKRWYNHVIKEGPEWDGDSPIFNYVLHPYAGAAYFMAARSNGFNFYQSFLYSACVSTIGWEFGIEAFMERPSIQDLVITPVVGSIVGELFYRAKRYLVENDYELLGSKVLGNIVAVLIDPLNEVVGIFDGNPARRVAGSGITFTPKIMNSFKGFTISAKF